ncbi:MAG: phage tail protein [Dehalococcoidales bacterium]|nr:phage tail protein [Dehalococcoidales bacterium]
MVSISNIMGTTLTGARLDLFPTFRFHVEIGSIIKAAFTECSGLEMNIDFKEYEEGGTNGFVHVFPGRTRYSHVTLKRGLIMTNELYTWFKEIEDCVRQGKKLKFQQVSIILWSPNQGFPEMRWNLDRAFPVKWVGPAFKTDEAAVSVETLELAHHGIQDMR